MDLKSSILYSDQKTDIYFSALSRAECEGKMKNTYLNRRTNRSNVLKNIAFTTVTVLLILISAFFISGTVQSQASGRLHVDESFYQDLEKEYVKEVRAYLNEQGFENSGVTLTRVVDEQGKREYSLTLHHKYLDSLSAEEIDAIFEEIEDMAFQAEDCSFRVSLLV